MSFFEYIKGTRSPKQRLIDAIRKNDVREVHELLESGVDPETRIHEYGEDTVLHQAAMRGHFLCLEELILAGANCDVENAFGITPIFNAARKGHALGMQVILKHSKRVLGLHTLWYDGKWTEFLHTSATDAVLSTLIIATPDINQMRVNLCSNILFQCVQRNYVQSLHMFFLSGYRSDLETCKIKVQDKITLLQNAIIDQEILMSNIADDTQKRYCLSGFQKVFDILCKKGAHSLQHLCRLRIRNSFHGNCNVYYGSEKIILPAPLKRYLVFRDGE